MTTPDKNSSVAKAIAAKKERDVAVAAGEERSGETAGELLKKLEREEAKTVHGAPLRAPKESLIDARAYEDVHPDKYVRYCSTRNAEKMLSRKAHGFTAVNEDEAANVGVDARIGEMVLMEQDRRLHEARVASQEKENERRLQQHRGEVARVAEAVAKEMRDKYGVNVPVERLLVDE